MSVAGKKAIVQKEKLDLFVKCVRRVTEEGTILQRISQVESESPGFIDHSLRQVKMGRYATMTNGILYLINKVEENPEFLKEASRDELMKTPGVSYKTASFFLIYTRKGIRIACLDRHILRFLVEKKILPPNSDRKVPRGDQYLFFEEKFLEYCGKRPPYQVDIQIWRKYNKSFN